MLKEIRYTFYSVFFAYKLTNLLGWLILHAQEALKGIIFVRLLTRHKHKDRHSATEIVFSHFSSKQLIRLLNCYCVNTIAIIFLYASDFSPF